MPVGGAPQMREKCKDSEEIIWPEKVLIWRDIGASGSEVEVSVEVEYGTAIKHCSDMYKQEERKDGA
jgi:hypothetical protein